MKKTSKKNKNTAKNETNNQKIVVECDSDKFVWCLKNRPILACDNEKCPFSGHSNAKWLIQGLVKLLAATTEDLWANNGDMLNDDRVLFLTQTIEFLRLSYRCRKTDKD